MSDEAKSPAKKGNGKTPDRRGGVDRRIVDLPFSGADRRHHTRRKPERSPDKPIKR